MVDLVQETIEVPGYEGVVKFTEKCSGLVAIVAVHNTKLGPGLGGVRIYPYESFDQALVDVLRLAKGMTYKAGIAQLGLGGAKSVIIADPKVDKTPELFRAFGECVNAFEGKYICAEDVGCTLEDIEEIAKTTKYVSGVCGLGGGGNPAVFTAWGTLCGIRAVLQELDGTDSVAGKTVAVQGVGSVGGRLVEHLFWLGAKLVISDLNRDIVEYYAHACGARVVAPEEIVSAECDVLSPCAMGGVITVDSIPRLRCRAVAGAANNQLLHDSDANLLLARQILYAPDFLVSSGGLINIVNELSAEGYRAVKAKEMTGEIFDRLLSTFKTAQQQSVSAHQVAIELVDYYIRHQIGKRVEDLCFRFDPIAVC